MFLEMDNVGILKDVSVDISGLTVITGKNSAGKTTVGKVLYSVLQANYNIEEAYDNARTEYIFSQLDTIRTLFTRFNLLSGISIKLNESNKIIEQYEPIKLLISGNYIESFIKCGIEKKIEYILNLRNSIRDMNLLQYRGIFQKRDKQILVKEDFVSGHFEDVVNEATELCDKTINSVQEDSFQLYVKDRTREFLNYEFHNQIKPIKNMRVISRINIFDEKNKMLNVLIHDKNNYELKTSSSLSVEKVLFIDNPFVIDSIYEEEKDYLFHSYNRKIESLGSYGVTSHDEYLLSLMRTKFTDNFFSNLDFQTSIKPALEKINEIIPGEFQETSDGFFYVENGSKLNVQNLATGSKMFSIIKILLMNGHFDKKTVLILDEPEAHLHPEWINKFAEIMVLLIKEIGIKVLLTTHSPNLLLAFEVNSRKYDLLNNTHFYLSQKEEKGWKSYIRCIDNNLNEAYSHLSIPLIELSIQKES